jgi:hypothetical protein
MESHRQYGNAYKLPSSTRKENMLKSNENDNVRTNFTIRILLTKLKGNSVGRSPETWGSKMGEWCVPNYYSLVI